MAETYFRRIPNLLYGNTLVKDITRRTRIVEDERYSPYVFYPYELKHDLRADQVAEYYYNDSYLDWFIYHVNGVIDPYYGWYLTEDDFHALLIEKYGSVENAQKKVKYYRNNWADYTDEEITVSYYENNLVDSLKKYWSPNWSPVTEKIVSYSRKRDDHLMNTNQILEFTISANNGSNSYVAGELVDIKLTGLNATRANGEVISANTTHIRIQHVSGNTHANSTIVIDIVGETSLANMSANAVSTVKENISNSEYVYWSPVYYYEWEREQNEQKKNILLVGDTDAPFLLQQYTEKLNEDVDPETGLSN